MTAGLVAVLCTSVATADALGAPGNDSSAAKIAEWGRDHGLGDVVTAVESLGYQADRPAEGGSPVDGIPSVAPAAADVVPDRGSPARTVPVAPLVPLAGGTPLPGEGQWHAVVTARGKPAVQVAFLRPDSRHTSFVAGVMRMDPGLVRGELHPGTTDPGGKWAAATSLAGSAGDGIAAAFNGGFKLSDPSGPGYFSEGKVVRPLVDAAASLVLHTDGHADVGTWNQEVSMTPDVVSVRQNLVPLVDGGNVNPECASGGPREWGSTIGQAAYIDRSGFGVTADGTEIYVAGPALSVCTVGGLLQDAGVVRGMELDINPSWVSGTYFPDGAKSGSRLYPSERVAPDHYLSPSSRDWFAWYVRS